MELGDAEINPGVDVFTIVIVSVSMALDGTDVTFDVTEIFSVTVVVAVASTEVVCRSVLMFVVREVTMVVAGDVLMVVAPNVSMIDV